jgi:hypothetical protein
MTALLAAGGGPPLALHIPHVVEQVGSIAGFAAVIGLAVLSALYFSQARDLRRLREWAGRAPERAAGGQQGAAPVPGRVVAVPQRAPQPPAVAGAATAAGVAQSVQPAGTNGSPQVEATKTPEGEEAKVGAGAEKAEGASGAEPDADGASKPGGDSTDGAEAKESENGGQDKAEGADQGAGTSSPSKPGMPAPASAAAAAAGAGAASVTAPAGTGAPAGVAGAGAGAAAAGAAAGAARAASPPPQRTPGSVLPPRTGTLPPVRRLPSSNVGRTGPPQPGVIDSALEPKRKRNPVYVVLAVVGVLVLGAGAAVGVPKLVNGAKSDTTPAKATTTKKKKAAKALPPISPDAITVSVLNATSIPGLAAQIGDQAQNIGFNLGSTAQVPGILEGSKPPRTVSLVMYVPGHIRDARLVAKKLSLPGRPRPIDAESRQLGGDATVVVVVGTDQTR